MIEIEIRTTKKKLSKSLIQQMQIASKDVLVHGTILGFINNVSKKLNKVILFERHKNYYIVSIDYRKSKYSIWNGPEQVQKFDTKEACDSYWSSYQIVLDTMPTQIYI